MTLQKEVFVARPEKFCISCQPTGYSLNLNWPVVPYVYYTLSLFSFRSRDRQGGQGDAMYPIGYSDKPVPDTSVQETDRNLVEKVAARVFCF